MHILLITRGVPDKNDPQWGCFEKDQAEALAALGHKVTVFSVDTRFRWYWRPFGITIKQQTGIKYYNYFLCPYAILHIFGETFARYFLRLQWQKLYRLICKQEGTPDILYPHYLFKTYDTVRFIDNLSVPIVAIEHWSELNKEILSPMVKRLGNYTYPRIHTLITVSQSLQKSIIRHFHQNSIVVYNMVGTEFFYKENTNTTNGYVRFVSTGSLIKRKGFDALINAFSLSNLPRNKWKLTIIGDGEEHQHLQHQIDESGLHDNILLIGQKGKQEIAEILNNSDVFVLPSHMETFGVSYIEAMACGLPIIATQCGGPEEFVTNRNGLLVPVNDVNALKNTLEYMYHHHNKYDRKDIAADCQSRFSPKTIAQQLTAIFEETLRNGPHK